MRRLILALICLHRVISTESCGSLPTVSNASPESRNVNPPFVIGTGIRYKCSQGYKEIGGSDEAVCLNVTGKLEWKPPTLICEPIGCGDPPLLSNALANIPDDISAPFALGTQIRYDCDAGYVKHDGTDEATCRIKDNLAQWSMPTLRCLGVSCGDPGDIMNGEKVGRLFTFPNNVTYRCDEGYNFTTDRNVLYCQPNGRWSIDPPACKAVECPTIAAPSNGDVKVKEFVFRSVAKYSCKIGFQLVGENERECQSSGKWSGLQPQCEVVNCVPLNNLPGGRIVLGAGHRHVGALMILRCNNPPDTKSLKCNENGDWSPPIPNCQVPTKATTATPTRQPNESTQKPKNTTESNKHWGVQCSNPGPISHGHLDPVVKFPTGNDVIYACDEGYTLKGKSVFKCLSTGVWDLEELPRCEKRMWIELIVGLSVGAVVVTVTVAGAVVFYLKKKRKGRSSNSQVHLHTSPPGVKNKALALDAKHRDEIRFLERERKVIPVTSL